MHLSRTKGRNGTTGKIGSRVGRVNGGPRIVTHDQNEVEKIRNEVLSGKCRHPDVAVLSAADLQRMRKEAVIVTHDELVQRKKIAEEQKEKQQALAKAKKERMIKLEEEKKRNAPLRNEFQIEAAEKRTALQQKAKKLLDENLDEVKHMKQLVNYAKVATVRDKQLDEKKFIYQRRVEEQKRLDLMMEMERLKTIKTIEEGEKVKKKERIAGHRVIIEQMKERELKRLKGKEEQAREAQAMVRHMKDIEEEEMVKGVKKKVKQKDMLEQIRQANQMAVEKKKLYKQKEVEEDDKIMKYAIEKDMKEAEYLAEQRRIKDEKEREVALLRERQEKAADRQAEIDSLRANRAMEQAERNARQKDRKEAEKRSSMNRELNEARRLQALEKERRLQIQAKKDRDEFQRIIEAQKEARDLEMKGERERLLKIKQHALELRKQMAMNEEKHHQKFRDKYEEGKKIRDKMLYERMTLDRIKKEKLGYLKQNGIPGKYQVDLEKYDI